MTSCSCGKKTLFRLFLVEGQSPGLDVSLGLPSWQRNCRRVTVSTAASGAGGGWCKNVLPTINQFPINPQRFEFPIANVSGGNLLSPCGCCWALTETSEALLPPPLLPCPASELLLLVESFSFILGEVMKNGRKTYQTWREGREKKSLVGRNDI